MSLQIQLKKSAVSQKQPFASDLAIGELALNYNANGPFLTCKDSAGNVRKLNNVWVATAAPNNPSAGDLWLDTSAATAVLKVYKDSTSTWVNATTIPVATTSIFGSVQLASAADITNATAGKVVDAAQLQSKISAELSANPITFQGVNVVNNVTIGGDLTVNGTQTIINTTTLDVEDKNIVIGNVATPSNTTADGGGISLLGATTKTLNWVNATGAWTSSERFSVPVGSAAAPSLTFTGDPDTGIYNSAANQVSISTAGTERLRIDPNGQLHAVSLGTAAAPVLSFLSDTNTGIYSPGADQLAISTGGLGRLFISSTGNVTVDSADALLNLKATSAGSYTNKGIRFAVDGTDYAHIYNEGVGNIVFRTSSGLSERLRITSAGLVGIGTSSPQALLTIGTNSPALEFNDADSTANNRRWQFYTSGTFLGIRCITDAGAGGGNSFLFNRSNEQVQSFQGTKDGSAWFHVDNSTARLGIGTTSPGYSLDVNGSASVVNLYKDSFYNSAFTVGNRANQPLILTTNDTERVRITSAGLVGIGTSSPSQNLHVASSGNTKLLVSSSFSGSTDTGILVDTTGDTSVGSLTFLKGGVSRGDIAYRHNASGGSERLGFSVAGGERLSVLGSGNVGIGTASPVARLHVSQGADSNIIQYIQGASNGIRLGTNTNAALIDGVDATNGSTSYQPLFLNGSDLRLGSGGAERARIDSSGRLLVGTSSAFVGTPLGGNLLIESSTQFGPQLNLRGLYDSSNPVFAIFDRARGSNIVQSGDNILQLDCRGFDGTNYLTAARIQAQVDGTPGVNDMPGRLVFSTTADGASSSTERLRITSAGNVGIGSPNPVANLEVLSSSVSVIRAATTDATGASIAGIQLDNLGAGASSLIARAGGNYTILSATTNTPLIFGTNNTERARIDGPGRLLVGTSTSTNFLGTTQPAFLQLKEDAGNFALGLQRASNDAAPPNIAFRKTRATTDGGVTAVADGDALGQIRFVGTDGTGAIQAALIRCDVDGTPGTNSMPGRIVLSTTASGASTPTERMRITNGGNINIGTGGGEVDAVSGTTDGATFYGAAGVQISRNGANVLTLRRRTSDGNIVAFTRDTTLVGSISVTTTATAYNTSSDYRLKENVVAVTDGITRLQQLKPSRFNFIADPTKTVDGFLAHEAAEVVPECVTGEKDAVNDDGNPVYQGIDQSKLVPLLTAALQEAVAKIESLEARLTAAGI